LLHDGQARHQARVIIRLDGDGSGLVARRNGRGELRGLGRLAAQLTDDAAGPQQRQPDRQGDWPTATLQGIVARLDRESGSLA